MRCSKSLPILKLKNQELLKLLASQQNAKGTVKQPASLVASRPQRTLRPKPPPRFCLDERIEVVARVQRESLGKVLGGTRASPACTRASRFQKISTSKRLCGKRSQLGPPFKGSSLAVRVSDCKRRSATSRVSSVRSTRRRTPRGLWGKDEKNQSASLLEQSGGASVPGWLVLHSRSLLPSMEAPPPSQRSRLATADCSTNLGSRSSGPRSHASVHERRSWCGRSRGKPRKRARKLQDPEQVQFGETRRTPLPSLYPSRVQRQRNALLEFGAIYPTWCRTAARRQHRFCSPRS